MTSSGRIPQIRKRDGRIVPLDPEKIKNAIQKAILAVRNEKAEAWYLADTVITTAEQRFEGSLPGVEDIQDIVEEILIREGYAEVAKAYILYRQKRTEDREHKALLGVRDDLKLSLNALKVLQRRYLLKNEKGEVTETPGGLFRRVAKAVAQTDVAYGGESQAKETEEKFYRMMANFEFLPNTPTLMNAGTDLGQLSACFVIPIPDSLKGIFEAVKHMTLIQQCLVPETLVMTKQGLKRLDKVRKGSLVITDEGSFRVSDIHNNGEQPVFEVVTEHGYKITGTGKHKLLVVDDEGKYVWREIKDLKEEDWLILKPGIWSGNDTKLPSFTFRRKLGGNQTSFKPREYKLPVQHTSELGELIGLYLGDGSNHRDGIRFTVSKDHPELLIRIKQLSNRLFGKDEITISDDPKRKSWEVSILSTQIKQWFNFLGITKSSSNKARIPPLILKSKKEILYGFLRGLFSTDGCIRKSGHIVLCTASKNLAEELQIVLLHLGIPTRLTHYKRAFSKNHSLLKDIYHVAICSKSGFMLFKEKIGFVVKTKQERLNAIDSSSIFVRGETIPNQRKAIKDWYKTLPKKVRWEVEPVYHNIIYRDPKSPQARQLSRQKVAKILEKEKFVPSFFHGLAENNLFFTKVKEIKFKGIRQVYDLTILYKHSYIANGFISHNSGGGTGFDFSKLRPKGDMVRSTHGVASGPISFMRVFDETTDVVRQGGRRRGANMGILRVDHPDIVEFITAKEKENFLTNFNVSVAVTDEFMKRVERDEEYELVNPHTGATTGKLPAKWVFDLIATSAWRTGDPGLVFIDEINRANPTPKLGKIESTNPCGEQPLLAFEPCNLGSINLSKMVKNGKVDWVHLKETVRLAVHFLDNVIDASKFPFPEITKMAQGNRKIGLGVMGFADLLLELGVPYDSERALGTAEKIMKFIEGEARKESQELGETRGSFPNFKGSLWEKKGYKAMRNATVTTVAPTGTISIIANCSSGIEPVFALSFIRQVMEGTQLLEVSPIFEKVAKERGFYSKELVLKVARSGSIQGRKEIPKDIQRIFVTALDIAPEWHVRMQAAFQKYVENAVSKTCNLPPEATPEDVKRIHWLAYELKCKGITIYRYGSKKEQVLYLGLPQEVVAGVAGEEPIRAESEYAGGCPAGECPF